MCWSLTQTFYDQVWGVTKSTSNSLYFSGESMNYDWPTIIKDITSYWYCTFTFCLLLAACGIQWRVYCPLKRQICLHSFNLLYIYIFWKASTRLGFHMTFIKCLQYQLSLPYSALHPSFLLLTPFKHSYSVTHPQPFILHSIAPPLKSLYHGALVISK